MDGKASPAAHADASVTQPDPLGLLGERVRRLRARRGMTRKILARDSGVSERYLAQVETGKGNMSLRILHDLARAFDVPLEALTSADPEPPVDFLHTVEFLRRLPIEDLKTARRLLREHFGPLDSAARHNRIALIGLRGAGKSTIGALLAEHLDMPFFELNGVIEQESGLTLNLIFDFRGQAGFRSLERECLENVVEQNQRFVLATGGSLVSEPATFDLLLASCFTAWVRASPEEHMQRVVAQGDMRPMQDNRDPMADLRRILAEREGLYGKADIQIDTSGHTSADSVQALIQALREAPTRQEQPAGV